jgi:GNAT superfamily N-acetyltransferase
MDESKDFLETPALGGKGIYSSIESIDFRRRGLNHRELYDFLNSQLRPHAKFSIHEEYPSLFGEFPGGQSLVLREEKGIMAHAGFVVREYQHPLFRLKMGLIGSVVTHRDFRGMGYGVAVLREVIAELKRQGCVLALLWSETPEFYQPLGFARSGREIDLRFEKSSVPENTGTVREFDFNHDVSQVWRLYHKHHAKLDRSLEEQKNLCRIPQARIFVTDKDSTLSSYIVINKGADFEDYIHEWGGDIYEIQRNIAHCQRYLFPDRPLTMIAPAFYDLGPLRQMAVEKWDGVLGMVKVLDKGKLLAAYYDYLKKSEIPFQWDRDRENFTVNNTSMPLRSDLDALTVVLGTDQKSDKPVLPIFLWGFDSI